MTSRRVLWGRALLFVLLCPIVPAQDFDIRGIPGYEGLVRAGSWNPLILEIRNRGETLAGDLVVATAGGFSGEPASYALRVPLTLERGELRRLRLVVPIERTVLPITATFQPRQDGILADSTSEQSITVTPFPEDRPLIVAVLDTPAILPEPPAQMVPVYVPPERLPDRSLGYDVVDHLVVGGAGGALLDPIQRGAIVRWIDRGGELTYLGSAEELVRVFPELLELDEPMGGVTLQGGAPLLISTEPGTPVRSVSQGYTEDEHGALVAQTLFRFPSRGTTALLLGLFVILLAITDRWGGSVLLTAAVAFSAAVALYAVTRVTIAPPPSAVLEYQTMTLGPGRAAAQLRREVILLAARPYRGELPIPLDLAPLPPRSGGLDLRREAEELLYGADLEAWQGRYLDLSGWAPAPVAVETGVRTGDGGTALRITLTNRSGADLGPVVYVDARIDLVLGVVESGSTIDWDIPIDAEGAVVTDEVSDAVPLGAHERRIILELRRSRAQEERLDGVSAPRLVAWGTAIEPALAFNPPPPRQAVRSRVVVVLAETGGGDATP